MSTSCAKPRRSNAQSIWVKILSSPTSSLAIRCAASHHLSDLIDTPLPAAPEQLSAHALENLHAVLRAHNFSHPALPDYKPWALWSDSDADADSDDSEDNRQPAAPPTTKHHHLTSDVQHITVPLPTGETTQADAQPSQQPSRPVAPAVNKPPSSKPDPALLPASTRTSTVTPTAEDLKHATALKAWAQTSPHTSPSSASVTHITNTHSLPTLLDILCPPMTSQPARAALLGALSPSLPPSAASTVQSAIILPFLISLKSAAPLDMLTAILSFASRHPRPISSLYVYFTTAPLTPPVAEVLTRVADSLPDSVALDALTSLCSATAWTEPTVPIVSALVAKCTSSPSLPGLLIPALERHVSSLSKSVRFGKLLFTIVNDIPQVSRSFKEPMENVCRRSNGFLAKRALTLLCNKLTAD